MIFSTITIDDIGLKARVGKWAAIVRDIESVSVTECVKIQFDA